MSFLGIRLRYFALVMAVIALAGGVYLTFFHNTGFLKAEALITEIEEIPGTFDNETEYNVTVRYTVDGKEYSGLLDQYSPTYHVGDKISILYNPADPAEFHGASLGLSIYMIVIGIVLLAIVLVTMVRERKNQKQLEAAKEAENGVTYAPSVPGPERQLYFLTDLGTPKYGHRIEDRSRRVLYEAKMTKYNLLQPFGFDFIDYEHNKTTPHLIGHQESSERGNSILFDNHYTFTFDGEFIWKHLKRNGITMETSLKKGTNLVGHNIKVFRDNVLIATVESSSQYVHEEDAAQHSALVNAIPAKGFYRIRTTETNLDLLFVAIMAFARTEASDDRGGNYKTLFNSIKKS